MERLDTSEITESALPGIGERFDLRAAEGGNVCVVIHHSGRRDVYVVDDDGEAQSAVTLTDSQARNLGAILAGAYFKPAVVAEIESVIDGLLIEWATLDADSPGVGHTIAELEVRTRTRMTIAAILRDHVPMVAPDPTERLQDGDRLVVIGRPEDLPAFRRHIVRS